MCITCGCESLTTPQSENQHHEHHHSHAQLTADHPVSTIIHHHYYNHVDVHYHYTAGSEQLAKAPHSHSHSHSHPQHHAHAHAHAHHHDDSLDDKNQRLIEIEQHVLAKNDHIAEHNRKHFADHHVFALNLMSSPGSGKTTLLTETLTYLSKKHACAVIEGDQQTSNDADRIAQTGVPVIQVNTGKGCHLDADMVHKAAHELELPKNGFLFIENVGNLVCPSSFDLGEHLKVVVISVTEGDDKPLKYPHMFAAAGLMIINKIDLLEHVNFDIEACINNAKKINPAIEVIKLSCVKSASLTDWFSWLENKRCV